jgi:hypothetical protein
MAFLDFAWRAEGRMGYLLSFVNMNPIPTSERPRRIREETTWLLSIQVGNQILTESSRPLTQFNTRQNYTYNKHQITRTIMNQRSFT